MEITNDSSVPMRALLAGARQKEAGLLELIRRLVVIESPSEDKAAVDACVALAAERSKALGGRVKLHKQRGFGNLLEARFGAKSKTAASSLSTSRLGAAGRTLVLGHLDTVWPRGTLAAMPCRMGADSAGQMRLWGPGVLDMKAGVAMALTAIEMLIEAGELEREIVLLLVSDEEVGSPASRPITEGLAAECGRVFVLEPAQGLAYKTARKGTGNWRIEIKGVAAHAGLDYEKGASALRELARAIETVSGWTDLKRGVTVSVGVAGGGSKSNVIPAEAWAEVDARMVRRADGAHLGRKFAALKAVDKRCTLTAVGGINRPPMERNRSTVRLLQEAKGLAAELGFLLEEAASGGASDGNFTSALGIPTLDGMGAVGEGAHARCESIVLKHLAPRTALLAGMLRGPGH